jgi:hypothetical protein
VYGLFVSLVQLRESVPGLIAKKACQGETTAISLNNISVSRLHLSRRGRKLDFGDQRYCHCYQFPQSSKRARMKADFQRGRAVGPAILVSPEADIEGPLGARC